MGMEGGKGDYASLSDDEWKKRLKPEQFYVTRQKGTERAFTGEYWNTKTLGTYHCVCCDTPLFESKSKFDSGTGWPSYYESIGNNVKSKLDMSIVFMPKRKLFCACNAHLGHVFDDGPPPTGKRYCINRGNKGYDEDDKGESVGKGIRVMEEKQSIYKQGCAFKKPRDHKDLSWMRIKPLEVRARQEFIDLAYLDVEMAWTTHLKELDLIYGKLMNNKGLVDNFPHPLVKRWQVEINIPELNPEMVCVQGSMGEGALAGMPLQLAGSRRILEFMDWGEYGAKDTFIRIGSIGSKDVDEQDDIFILVAPQNAVGNCIIEDLQAMTDAAGQRPVILINPRLKDLPGSSGIMQAMGRDKRLEYASSFEDCYFFRLLYYAGTQYQLMSYPQEYELYKRVDESFGKEKYVTIASFPVKPTLDEVNDAFEGKSRSKEKKASGLWKLRDSSGGGRKERQPRERKEKDGFFGFLLPTTLRSLQTTSMAFVAFEILLQSLPSDKKAMRRPPHLSPSIFVFHSSFLLFFLLPFHCTGGVHSLLSPSPAPLHSTPANPISASFLSAAPSPAVIQRQHFRKRVDHCCFSLLSCYNYNSSSYLFCLGMLAKESSRSWPKRPKPSVGLPLDPIFTKLNSVNTMKRKTLVPMIEYSSLVSATNNFSQDNILGEGRMSSIYRSCFEGGVLAAVKKLDGSVPDYERMFDNELELLGRIKHPNIVSLLGYSTHGDSRFLVHELPQNGSLEEQLHGQSHGSALTWHLRMKIALDIARGLEYLHEHCSPSVIHRDLKSSNVILDSDFNAKISDFGLAVCVDNQTKLSVKLSGNLGYLAPEYILDGKLTEKSDVYAFGVVLLELLLGRKPVEKMAPSQCQSLVTWAMPQLTNRSKLPCLVDPVIKDTMEPKHLYQVAAIAVLCVQPEPSYRPLITDVLHSLIPLVTTELGGTHGCRQNTS
ncbi:hypothetical protein HPP92_003532 [Vanilla planifolia]|uniref:Peptide methionine sulfoxide reductase B1, chloroplastic n=1 Tax=Vanilla planifolia TaxID=51239 RepID=A0A835SAJ8_VANPL|nr:hypothetical protein HPP92_003532 [Vanilla planifolia]